MLKIKIQNKQIDYEEKFKKYTSIFPELNNNLNDNFIKLKDLIFSGILKKDSYNLFKENDNNFKFNMAMTFFRDEYINQFGFYIISENFLKSVNTLFSNNKIIEVGAGSGFLSLCLQQNGIDITPTDKKIIDNKYGFNTTHTKIIETDSVKFLKQNKNKYDTVLMSWPDYSSSFASNILSSMNSGQTLIYIGENIGGCTADDLFFEQLENCAELLPMETNLLNENSFSWFGIHDKVNVYKIK